MTLSPVFHGAAGRNLVLAARERPRSEGARAAILPPGETIIADCRSGVESSGRMPGRPRRRPRRCRLEDVRPVRSPAPPAHRPPAAPHEHIRHQPVLPRRAGRASGDRRRRGPAGRRRRGAGTRLPGYAPGPFLRRRRPDRRRRSARDGTLHQRQRRVAARWRHHPDPCRAGVPGGSQPHDGAFGRVPHRCHRHVLGLDLVRPRADRSACPLPGRSRAGASAAAFVSPSIRPCRATASEPTSTSISDPRSARSSRWNTSSIPGWASNCAASANGTSRSRACRRWTATMSDCS